MKFHRWPTMVILSPSVVLLEASDIIWPRIEPTSRFDDANTHNFIPPSRWWFLKSCSPLPISGEIIQFDPIFFHFESKHQPLHRHVWLGFTGFLLTGSKPKRPELLMLLGFRRREATLRDTNGTTKTYKIVLCSCCFAYKKPVMTYRSF